MRVVIDINHPAHVHVFRNCYQWLKDHGHSVLVVASKKDVCLDLLDDFGIEYHCIGSYGKGLVTKLANLPVLDYRFYRLVKPFKPDVMIGIASVRVAHVGFLLGVRTFIFNDTEHARLTKLLYAPFAQNIVVPMSFFGKKNAKYICYEGCHELAYLSPDVFTPDESVVQRLGLGPDERFFLLRLVGWDAAHDRGVERLSLSGWRDVVKKLERLGKVFIVSEAELPEELQDHRLPDIAPGELHHLLAYASGYVGEGGTMASEAAILGVPSIYVNPLRMGYIEELKKLDLVKQECNQEGVMAAIDCWLSDSTQATCHRERSRKFVDRCDNVGEKIVDLVLHGVNN